VACFPCDQPDITCWLHGSETAKKKKGGAGMSDTGLTPLDDIIEDAWHIFQRERDQQPCSIRRRILMQKIVEMAEPILASRVIPPAKQTFTPPIPHYDR
jgi:hypothetical protein